MPTTGREMQNPIPRAVLVRWAGLLLAPLAAAIIYLILPDHSTGNANALSHSGRAIAAVAAAMAILWITEALPISATALIPVALFPLVTHGEISAREAASSYAHELIFLFLGGFLLALAMQRWNLHRRIALRTILIFGTKPRAIIAGFMLAAAGLSMWVSNTATVVMMLPIATSVIELVRHQKDRSEKDVSRFAICLLLATAYASSIGGIGTLIGTPPNALLAAFVEREFGVQISFARWMLTCLPLVAVMLPICWIMLTRAVCRVPDEPIRGGRALIREQLDRQGPMSRAEKMTLAVFTLTAAAWICRPLLSAITIGSAQPLAGLTDAGVAMIGGLSLFVLPVAARRGEFLLDWETARKLPWGILILFGGGLALARAMRETGVAAYIGHSVTSAGTVPEPLLVLLVTATVVFLTELTSNTATTATFLPILAAVATGLGMPPMMLLLPMTIGASLAFMMPVATPPNAVVFASGELTIAQMCKAGLWMNLIGIALVMATVYLLAGRLLALPAN